MSSARTPPVHKIKRFSPHVQITDHYCPPPPLLPPPPRHVQIRKRKTQTKEVRSAAREMALREVKSRKKAVKKGGKKR